MELKPLIIQQGQIEISPQQWQAMEQAIVLSDPFDVMQSDSSNLLTLSQVLERIPQKIQEIKARFGTSAAEEMNTVLEIWRRRVHKFFSQPALYLLRFLNPAENQNSWSREEREALLELLVTCIRHYCAARQLAFDDDEVKYDLGKFLNRKILVGIRNFLDCQCCLGTLFITLCCSVGEYQCHRGSC